MKTQQGLVGIIALLILAIALGVGGTYWYLKKDLVKSPELDITVKNSTSTAPDQTYDIPNAPVVAPGENNPVASDSKTYFSAQIGFSFSYPKNLYAHAEPRYYTHESRHTVMLTTEAVLPPPPEAGDGNIYGYKVMVSSLPITGPTDPNTLAKVVQDANAHSDLADYAKTAMQKAGLATTAKVVTINGVQVAQIPYFSDLEGHIVVQYVLLQGGMKYFFQPNTYEDKASVAATHEVIGSFKVLR